jgi:hypothetical protein
MSKEDITGRKVRIMRGEFAGSSAICLGKATGPLWAISPDASNLVLELELVADFELLPEGNGKKENQRKRR